MSRPSRRKPTASTTPESKRRRPSRPGAASRGVLSSGQHALSNEVVRYQPGGAHLALTELRRRIRICPKRPVAPAVAGVPYLTYRFLSTLHRADWVPNTIAVTFSATAKGRTAYETAIYQFDGDFLSVIYGLADRAGRPDPLVIKAADAAAGRLRSALGA